jgi:NADPH2:quinone reductase
VRVRVVVMERPGGTEVLRETVQELRPPGNGEVLIRQTAIGLNYIDIQHRSGRYPLPSYPAVIGMEGAGIIEQVGDGIEDNFKPGDRVAYASHPIGAYAEIRLMPADRLVPLPSDIADQTAAGIMMKGLTASYLVSGAYRIKPGDTVLVHAAAGGVGLLFCQWARHLGATVIGTVSTEEKAVLARARGCHHPIVYTRQNFVDEVTRITEGKGVPVVFDSVGKDTFQGSLRCLARRGLLVSYGSASGPIPPFDLFELNRLGALFVTSASIFIYTEQRRELLERASELFRLVSSKTLKVDIAHTYPLAEVARAHAELQARHTTGTTILVP